jgi:prevent-host-death family protein
VISVSIAEARARMSELVDRLTEEEEVLITRHGQTVARLVAVPRTRLYDHYISEPVPLAHETLPGDFDELVSGPMTLR